MKCSSLHLLILIACMYLSFQLISCEFEKSESHKKYLKAASLVQIPQPNKEKGSNDFARSKLILIRLLKLYLGLFLLLSVSSFLKWFEEAYYIRELYLKSQEESIINFERGDDIAFTEKKLIYTSGVVYSTKPTSESILGIFFDQNPQALIISRECFLIDIKSNRQLMKIEDRNMTEGRFSEVEIVSDNIRFPSCLCSKTIHEDLKVNGIGLNSQQIDFILNNSELHPISLRKEDEIRKELEVDDWSALYADFFFPEFRVTSFQYNLDDSSIILFCTDSEKYAVKIKLFQVRIIINYF